MKGRQTPWRMSLRRISEDGYLVIVITSVMVIDSKGTMLCKQRITCNFLQNKGGASQKGKD